MAGALQGIRIVDLTRVLAGPWATQLLADFGADVIKVEHPKGGDDTRGWGPPWFDAADGSERESAYFLCANRGKRSVAIDIGQTEGARIVADMVAEADILIENFKVGGLAKYGLDYAALNAINPGLVYCSITGFGQDGPYSQRPGYDSIVQGMGGMMSVTGATDGDPMKAGVAIVDVFTGLYAANAVQAALRHRDRTGLGQHIDVALLDVEVAVMANVGLNYLVSGRAPQRHGNAHASIVPYQAFDTSDRKITVAVGNDQQFARFADVLAMPELAKDPRYATNEARVAHREMLIPVLAEKLKQRAADELLAACAKVGVPAGPINNMAEVFADEQVRHRGMALKTNHALGAAPGVRAPVRMSLTPVGSDKAAPQLGADSRATLESLLGMSPEAIRSLADRGIVGGVD